MMKEESAVWSATYAAVAAQVVKGSMTPSGTYPSEIVDHAGSIAAQMAERAVSDFRTFAPKTDAEETPNGVGSR